MLTNSNPGIQPGTSDVMSVSQLNQSVSRLLERSFPLAWVAGEISNFTRASSGHWYFTLKDASAQIKAVMFRGRAQYADFLPREGDRVEVRALVTLYAARGDYQLGVEMIRRAGVGNLYEAFLQLKSKLANEGLFDPATKRPVPVFARCIGVITSPQAAALQDVLTTLQRRAPHCRIIVFPTPVQGVGAAEKIAGAIATAASLHQCDVLLVCRGGGSIEDLWAFNEEVVARAIAACSIPVISGIGHETDITIADFVADVRAPTPTAAAELAARPCSEWQSLLKISAELLHRSFIRQQSERMQTLDWLARRLVSPTAVIRQERIKLRGLQQQLFHANRIPLTAARHALKQQEMRLIVQLPDTSQMWMKLTMHTRRLSLRVRLLQDQRRQHLKAVASQLELLNPQRTLERGYAIVTNASGVILRAPRSIHARDVIGLQLAGGSIEVGIASVQARLD
jgi:exodeoxyribonuclease VII large subunit